MSTISAKTLIVLSQSSGSIFCIADGSGPSMCSVPITILNSGTDTLSVTFSSNVTLNSTADYFTLGSDNIDVDGQGNTVTIIVANYPGLFSTTNNNIILENIGMN